MGLLLKLMAEAAARSPDAIELERIATHVAERHNVSAADLLAAAGEFVNGEGQTIPGRSSVAEYAASPSWLDRVRKKIVALGVVSRCLRQDKNAVVLLDANGQPVAAQ